MQLQHVLVHGSSLKTILHLRTKLAYCQFIRESNKAKQLEWARKYTEEEANDDFTDVVWTDESTRWGRLRINT